MSSWFYFSIAGGEIDQVITLKVVNLNKQSPLYSNDYRVIQKTVPIDIDWKRSGYFFFFFDNCYCE